jgi:transcriptional regulator with XRE-family HTH domain
MDQRPLARFLRSRRALLGPTDVGLTDAGPRRTRGLRREEIAALAHISASYYARLEQARGPRPSAAVISSLSNALMLSDDERTLLFTLSGRSPERDDRTLRSDVTPSVLDLIDRMPGTAAIILNAKFDVLALNPLASALFEAFSAQANTERNLARAYFLAPDPSRRHYGVSATEDFAEFAVSQLRAAAERYPGDRGLAGLVTELRSRSVEFERLWHEVDNVLPRHQKKSLDHSVVGWIELHCNVLSIPDRDQSVVLFTADPGTTSHRALCSLALVDSEDLETATYR